MWDQQSLRLACAYVQSDQSLCSRLNILSVKLLAEHRLEFVSLKGAAQARLSLYTRQNATLLEITCRGSIYEPMRTIRWVHSNLKE